MAADYGKRVQSDNKHLQDATTAKFKHIDGGVTTPVTVIPNTSGGRLLRVVLNTNGATLILRSGSRVIANIATDAPEGTYNYGVYCENGLIAEASGAMSATVIFG